MKLFRSRRTYPLSVDERVAMTCSCQDCESLPKVSLAGQIVDYQGERVQIMHDGTRVVAGGYHGEWMQKIIKGLRGHHEPQEELIFHHILKHVAPSSLILELGAFWCYYSNWFLGAVPGSRAVCVEPDANNLKCGRRNFELNSREALLINACVGAEYFAKTTLQRESDNRLVELPCHNMNSLLDILGEQSIEVLHIDAQGAELPFLDSTREAVGKKLLRFVVVSTHHTSISGSVTTHQDCLELIRDMGGAVLAEHTVEQSFSGDGLIAASFHVADRAITMPRISINHAEGSLFGPQGD